MKTEETKSVKSVRKPKMPWTKETKEKKAPAAPVNKGYDASADKTICVVGLVDAGRDEGIEVAVRKYGNGPARVSLIKRGEKFITTKIGRMDGQVALDVAKLMLEAGRVAKKHNAD